MGEVRMRQIVSLSRNNRWHHMWLRILLSSVNINIISWHICTEVFILARAILPINAIGPLGLVEFIVHFRWRTEMIALLLRPRIFEKNLCDIMRLSQMLLNLFIRCELHLIKV